MIYPTLPGSSLRDYSKPGARIQGDTMVPTLPGSGLRDYSKPSTCIKDDTISPTLPGTKLRDYSKPSERIEVKSDEDHSREKMWYQHKMLTEETEPPKAETPSIEPKPYKLKTPMKKTPVKYPSIIENNNTKD